MLVVAEPKATKQKKLVIVDPKVKEDLKGNMKKEVTPPKTEPKRILITRSKTTQSLAAKEKGSPTKRRLTKGTKKSLPKRPQRKLIVTPDKEEDNEEENESGDLRKL